MAKYSANTTAYEGRYLNLTINQVQNIEKNTSTLNWTLTSTGGKSKYYTIYPTTIKINGVEVYAKGTTNWDTYQFPAATGSVEGSIEVEHNSDGSKTIDVYFYTGVYYSSYQKDYGGSFTLDKIPRANSIAVSNYDLGQNIGISIGKKASSFTSTLTYKIGSRTGTIAEKISDASYVWEMPDELISQIKQDNPSNAKPSATIYCDTYSGNTKIGETQSCNFTLFITDKPTLTSISTKEIRADINQLTTAVLKSISIRNVFAEGTAPEGTSISNYKLKWGNIEITSTDGIFEIDNIQYSYLDENGNRKTKFTVVVTDERGNSSDSFFSTDEYPFICDFIEYVKPAFNNTDVKLTRLNGTSNYIKLHMTGYVYNGLIGETQNTLIIQYRYKLKNDTSAKWSDLKPIQVTLNDDNTFIVDDFQFEDEFDYKENYDIEFYADDLFVTAIYNAVIKTSETIAKWHKNGAFIKEIDVDKLRIKSMDVPKFSYAKMTTNFEVQTFTTTSHKKIEGWKLNYEYGDYNVDVDNSRIIVKNTTLLGLSGLLCGNGYASIQYRIYSSEDETTEVLGSAGRQSIFQYAGNGYFQTPLSNVVYELEPTKIYYVYLYVASYNNSNFQLNNGFGTNGTWVQALKLL